MRIIIIVLVIFLVYMIARSLLNKKVKVMKKGKREIQFCKYCNSYVVNEDCCKDNNINYKNCKNYK